MGCFPWVCVVGSAVSVWGVCEVVAGLDGYAQRAVGQEAGEAVQVVAGRCGQA
jgi:hypothetical protein